MRHSTESAHQSCRKVPPTRIVQAERSKRGKLYFECDNCRKVPPKHIDKNTIFKDLKGEIMMV
ncbi:hypothetical protein AKJ16_DCAP07349 [Drosera capensis]